MGAILIKAFAGGVLGGLNSLIGVFCGCLALGVAENLAGAYVSPSFADAITFIIIIAVLVVRPEGVFGTREGAQGMSAAADIARAASARTNVRLGARRCSSCLAARLRRAPRPQRLRRSISLTLTGIFALVALGLNFLVGYAGQISLCHAAFFGVGAYATALLTEKAGVPYVLSLASSAGLFTTAIGALVAVPALRLRAFIWPSRPSASASSCRRSSSSGAA